MPNPAAVALLAERLPNGLVHPGDPDSNQPAKLIPLPMLGGRGIPPQMQEHFTSQAGLPSNDAPKLLAEAIINLLETEGFDLTPKTEIQHLRQQAATMDNTPPGTPITIMCRCGTPLLHITSGRATVTVDGNKLQHRCS